MVLLRSGPDIFCRIQYVNLEYSHRGFFPIRRGPPGLHGLAGIGTENFDVIPSSLNPVSNSEIRANEPWLLSIKMQNDAGPHRTIFGRRSDVLPGSYSPIKTPFK
ncbi:hypothetical protein PM082_000630 [Marasmius tenuissimus]|nr:hypothetical protein PM082_000630 [Marasmius tenuissimus]